LKKSGKEDISGEGNIEAWVPAAKWCHWNKVMANLFYYKNNIRLATPIHPKSVIGCSVKTDDISIIELA
jgi:hypothetical protein